MNKFFVLSFSLLLGIWVTAYGQTFNVKDLRIKLEVLGTDNSGKTVSELSFINQGKGTFPGRGWVLYFNSRPLTVYGIDSLNSRIENINGDLFRFIPLNGFSALKAGSSRKIHLQSEEIKNKTDLASGFYLVWDKSSSIGYNISSTTVYPAKQVEKTELEVAAHVFNENKLIRDMPLSQVPKVFPTPVSFKEGQGFFKLTPAVSIEADDAFKKEALLFAADLNGLMGRSPVILNNGLGKAGIVLKKGDTGENESYTLSVTTERILITAADAAGAFYGIQSLKTLFPPEAWRTVHQEVAIPVIEVKDAPRFEFRGFMMDVGRNFQPKDEVLKVLDVMALYKMNVLHFHLSDDEGWRLEIPGLPELTDVGSKRGHTLDDRHNLLPSYGSGAVSGINSGSGFYNRKDFIDILRYATTRHIRVIPEIETPGHARAAIKSMDARYARLMKEGKKEDAEQYLLRDLNDKSKYRSVQNWDDNVINVALPSTYNFIEKVVDEIRAMYVDAQAPLSTIHFGGDEVPAGVWEQSPAVVDLLKRDTSIKGVDEMWYYYFHNINALLKSRQLYVTGWEEIGLRKAMVNGEKRMVLDTRFSKENFHTDVWNNLSGNEDLAYKLANAGYKVVLTCVTNLYIDLASNRSFNETGQYWGGYVDVDKPFYFIPYDLFKSLRDDENGGPVDNNFLKGKTVLTEFGKSNIMGMQSPLWSEIIKDKERFEYMLLPKLLGVAERAWAKNPEWATEADSLKSKDLYNDAWSEFMNVIGKKELHRLNHYSGGYNYRIPTPGLHVEDGMVWANVQLPGFVIRYTTDGTEPTVSSKRYLAPVASKGTLLFRVFNAEGKAGRSVKVPLNMK